MEIDLWFTILSANPSSGLKPVLKRSSYDVILPYTELCLITLVDSPPVVGPTKKNDPRFFFLIPVPPCMGSGCFFKKPRMILKLLAKL
jgi:hypothetical protein